MEINHGVKYFLEFQNLKGQLANERSHTELIQSKIFIFWKWNIKQMKYYFCPESFMIYNS